MWTVLGVLALVGIILWAIIKRVGLFLFYTGVASSNKDSTQRKIDKANAEKKQLEDFSTIRIMNKEFRARKKKEKPVTVFVDEKYVYGDRWDNTGRHTELKKVEPQLLYAENGIKTTCLDEYFININLEKSCYDYPYYLRERRDYYTRTAMLVYRYICTESNEKLVQGLVQLMVDDKELLIDFMHECHAANEWKKEYKQVYDCDNYMQDFLEENHILERIKEKTGYETENLADLRWFRKGTPSYEAQRDIDHELSKRSNIGKAAESEMETKKLSGGLAISTVIGIILIIILIAILSSQDYDLARIWGGLCTLYFFVWTGILVMAVGSQSNTDSLEEKDKSAEEYISFFPREQNKAGLHYGTDLDRERHPKCQY